MPHPNLSDAVNRNVIGSEVEGGVFLDRLQPHSVLQIQTQHRCYTANSAQLVKVSAVPRSLREADGHSRGISISSDLLVCWRFL